MRCSSDVCHILFFTIISISILFHYDNINITGMFMSIAIHFEPQI